MFVFQIRQTGLVVASLALAFSVLTTPASAAMSQESTHAVDSSSTRQIGLQVDDLVTAQSVAGGSLLNPAIEVTYLRKVAIQHPVNKTGYRFTAKNTGNLTFSTVGVLANCHYKEADGSMFWTDWGTDTTPGSMSNLEPGKSFEFVFYCDPVRNGATLHHGRAKVAGYLSSNSGQKTLWYEAESN